MVEHGGGVADVGEVAERVAHDDDGAALALQALEVRALVYLALAPQQVGFLVCDVRTRALAPRHLEGQGRQMRALDVVVQIRRRKKDVSVSALHGPDDDA